MIEFLAFLVLGVVVGVIASTLGVGGGVVFVPALVVFFGFSQYTAQGTSLAVIVPTAIVGALAHGRRGRVDWRVAGLIASGGVVGGIAGSTLALSIDPELLRRLFAVLLVVVAVRLISR
ncbi:MAG: sulfite exporter TauE/SafE family protein [Acidimicrobiia bacterium]|nr:sulfite exporter TauE/SafE family protein [Acidimicrobiia bacterium]